MSDGVQWLSSDLEPAARRGADIVASNVGTVENGEKLFPGPSRMKGEPSHTR